MTAHSTAHIFSHDGNSKNNSLSSSHDPSSTKHESQMQAQAHARAHTHRHTQTHTHTHTHNINSVSHEQWVLKLAANSKHQVTSVLFWWSMTSNIPLHSTSHTRQSLSLSINIVCGPVQHSHIQDVPNNYKLIPTFNLNCWYFIS